MGSNLLDFFETGIGPAPSMELEEGRTSDMGEMCLCFRIWEVFGDEREKREKGEGEEERDDDERETARRGSVEVTKKSRTTFPKQRMFSLGDPGNVCWGRRKLALRLELKGAWGKEARLFEREGQRPSSNDEKLTACCMVQELGSSFIVLPFILCFFVWSSQLLPAFFHVFQATQEKRKVGSPSFS